MAAQRTWLPVDQVTHGAMNAEVRDRLNAQYGPPCFELRQTATYAATRASEIIARPVMFNAKYFDASYDGSVMVPAGAGPWSYVTVMIPGTYLILAQTAWPGSADGKMRYLGAYLDQQVAAGGAMDDTARITYQTEYAESDATMPSSLDLEIEFQLGAGNTVQLGMFQNSGNAMNIDPGADRFFFQMIRLSD